MSWWPSGQDLILYFIVSFIASFVVSDHDRRLYILAILCDKPILVGWSDYAWARALTNNYNNIYKLLWKWDVSCSWDLVEMRPSMHCNIMLLFARSELEDTWWLVHAVLQLWDMFISVADDTWEQDYWISLHPSQHPSHTVTCPGHMTRAALALHWVDGRVLQFCLLGFSKSVKSFGENAVFKHPFL